MAFPIKLVFFSVVTVAVAFPSTIRAPSSTILDSYVPQEGSIEVEEPSYAAFALPTNLQLPKTDSSQVPFFVPDLSTVLKAPQYNSQPTYYESPIPAQDLEAPVESAVWNPDNDPKYFYEVPAVLTLQETPTGAFPKKFNQDLHQKNKPFSSVPKQEITLQPISEKEYNVKQKSLSKAFDKLAKQQNKKIIQQAQQTVQV